MKSSRYVLFFLAVVCAFSVANIYYVQPLIYLISTDFKSGVESASSLAMIIQLSYAAGLLLFVPLGDRISRKLLIFLLLSVSAFFSLCAAFSSSILALKLFSIFIGVTSVGAQIIIPVAPAFVTENRKGRALGVVTSGLLIGVLLGRTMSGLISEYWGWRAVYFFAVLGDFISIILALLIIPHGSPTAKGNYLTLFKSMWELFVSERILRSSALCGALVFGAFSAVWGGLAFLAAQPPLELNSAEVGAFGLAGIVGAVAAPFIGRYADKVGHYKVVLLGVIFNILAFSAIYFAPYTLFALIFGMIALDIGGRANLIGNQLAALSVSNDARSRLNTVFMFSYFIGGAFGTWLGALVAVKYSWQGISCLGIVIVVVVGVLVLRFMSRSHSR